MRDIPSYDPASLEAKWQASWAERHTNEPDLDRAARPFYNLMMFPYPSAEGLHVGNMFAFTGADIYGRFKRLQGYDVFEPMGFDAFGIHSENYALNVGTNPEWEKAARGEDGRLNPWGNQSAGLTRANFGRTGLSGPVRDRPERLLLYPPLISVDKYENAVSPYGAYQMMGNVAEWVSDWYDQDYYKVAPNRNPKGPETGTQKAFRGGGWMDSTTTMRAAMRNGTDPTTKINWMGFRCAKSVGERPLARDEREDGVYPSPLALHH